MNSTLILPIIAEAAGNPWETLSFKAAVYLAIFTILAGICAGIWAVVVWRREAEWRREDHAAELKQRAEELGWKQAELARTLLDEIFDYGQSNDAWRMVDGEKKYKDGDNEHHITMDLVRQALPKPWHDGSGGTNLYVRCCFDALFYYLERLEQPVKSNLVRFEDLSAPITYYISLMAKDKKLFLEYAELIRFHGAVAFMNRFPEWQNN